MRAYRFVDFLGSQFDAAGRTVAESALVEFDHSGGLKAGGADTPNERVGYELLRQIARRLDGTEWNRVRIDARSLAPVNEASTSGESGGAMGLIYQASLPGFEYRSAVVTETHYRPHFENRDSHGETGVETDRLDGWLETTPAVYLLMVDEANVRVLPGHAVASLTGPLDRTTIAEQLYSKSLRRFTEGFVEGFHGDAGLLEEFRYGDTSMDLEEACRDWAGEYGLDGVLFVHLEPIPNREPSSLRDFV